MIEKQLNMVINTLNLGDEKVWYVPVRSGGTIENYNNSIIKGTTHDGKQLEANFWAFKDGPKNKANFDAMHVGDYVCFITRDLEGYETIDTFATVNNKFIDASVGLKIWNDIQYELIIEFDSVFVLANKLRLTKNRTKLENILLGVPDEIFHNGYEMFRQWVLNKRLSRTKLGPKLIEENEFISIIKETCGGKYIKGNREKEVVSRDEELNKSYDINESIKKFENAFDGTFENLDKIFIKKRNRNENDGKNELSSKTSSSERNKLKPRNQKLIGLTGEKLVYNMLLKGQEQLLKELGIGSKEDILQIEWSNINYEDDFENFEDLSHGHDIKVFLKGRILKLEVKTSYKNSGFYSITRNELKEMAKYKEDYFIVKVNHLERLVDSRPPEIVLENFPILSILENLNRVKGMEIYL